MEENIRMHKDKVSVLKEKRSKAKKEIKALREERA